jgi:hypothetical protein
MRLLAGGSSSKLCMGCKAGREFHRRAAKRRVWHRYHPGVSGF